MADRAVSGPFPVNGLADLARAVVIMEQSGAIGTAHLLRALAAGRIALLPLMPGESAAKFKAWARLTEGRPAVALIGHDDGFDRGASGWAQARRAVKWARAIMLHAAGAELHHYECAIISAELCQRTLIIECGTATLHGWIELVRAAPRQPITFVIQPRDGGTHPLPARREGLH
jgi:hypothetical protein